MSTRRLSRALIAALVIVFAAEARAEEPSPSPSPELEAPVPIERADALYPPDALAAHQEAHVLLTATVGIDGSVSAVEVAESGGPAFDRAAREALEKWRFRPARRNGVPFAARIRVPFNFALAGHPHEKPHAPPPPPEDHIAVSEPQPEPEHHEHTPGQYESKVKGKTQPRTTSDFVLDHKVLTAAPHQSSGDLLLSAPGVYVARPEGDAVAHQVYLRGFDAEHGQDIEFLVGPVPVNQPGHIHGQGYADINFVIPEVVRSLRVTEGVFDPRQGDFAVAGSVEFDLGVAQRGFQSHTAYGSFNTFRQLALWAPRGQPEETFAAVAIRRTDGYGQNRGSLAGGAIGQYAFGSGAVRGVAHVSAYGGRSGLAGVLRLDDIGAGRVGFYDSYPDPLANAQSAFSARAQASVSLEHRSAAGARTGFSVFLVFTDFRLRENFTGYLERSRLRPEWVGRGDLIEQENQDWSLGARVFHRSRRFVPRPWLHGTFEAGMQFRLDLIEQAQNLLQSDNETWDKRVDAGVRGADIGLYGDADWRITKYLHIRGGIRADILYYDVDDRLGNFIPSFMRETHLVGFRRTALGVAWGPRVAVEIEPRHWLTLSLAYGEGYRSPQPRLLGEGENAPFAKVRSVEGGVRLRLLADRLNITAAGYATFLSSDLAFDPGEGRLEKIGPTTRAGIAAHVMARPWSWALASISVTWVHATLDAPPPATAENPAPPFTAGQLLPYVPPIVVRADVGIDRDFAIVRGRAFGGRAGLGFTFLSPRPLPYGESADPVSLLDLSTSLRWWFLELGVQIFNVIGTQYAAVEYSFVSDWGTSAVPSRIPARHIAAGPPRTVMGTLGLHF